VGTAGPLSPSVFDPAPAELEPGPVPSSGHDAAMTDATPPQELTSIRDRLDVLDRRLVDLLAERARLIAEVIAFKRAHALHVVDRPREERMLDKIGALGHDAGLDPRIARQVLRAVIDAFTLLEVEQLGPDV
jgi:chorismate mutase